MFADPEQRKLLALMLGAGLLGNRGQFGPGISQGLLGAMQAQQQNKQMKMREGEEAQQREMRAMQMEQMKAALANEQGQAQAARQAFAPPQMSPNDPYGAHQTPGGGGMPEFLRNAAPFMKASELVAAHQKQQPDYMPVAPGASVLDRRTGKPVFQAPEKTPDWKDPQYEAVQSRIRAAGRPQVTTNVMPPREIFKDSMALKKDFDAQPEVKGFKEVQGAWDQISTALRDPTAANDLAAATKFMKLLDPGSVVRESELFMAMQASGAWDRFTNYGNQILKGHKLTPQQRIEFHSAGEALYNASKFRFGETAAQYEGIAKQYGLDAQFLPKSKPTDNGPLKRNLTATVKAREAIKRGADPVAVRQRLREQGFDDAGL